MTALLAIILGIVQGVTEFLPISSSGFLILTPELFGWQLQDIAFDSIVHLATLVAVIHVFRDDVKKMISGVAQKNVWGSTARLILLSTIPVLVVGFFFKDFISLYARSFTVVAWSFIVWGTVLYFADHFSKERIEKLNLVGFKRAMLIGLAQVIALIPGTSRSGITITAGLAQGLSREVATRFSFLMAIPVLFAVGVLGLYEIAAVEAVIDPLVLIIGFASAFIASYITIVFLFDFIKRFSYKPIAIFRILLGLMILFL